MLDCWLNPNIVEKYGETSLKFDYFQSDNEVNKKFPLSENSEENFQEILVGRCGYEEEQAKIPMQKIIIILVV